MTGTQLITVHWVKEMFNETPIQHLWREVHLVSTGKLFPWGDGLYSC